MTITADVAIVGGGPAGAVAAYFLASRGHSTVVCERGTFPRDKPCGDGLTPRAIAVLEAMGMDGQLASWSQVRGVRVHRSGTTRPAPIPRTDGWRGWGLVVPRHRLDHAVLARAAEAGAEVLFDTCAVAPTWEDGSVSGLVARHRGRLRQIRARWVVCAEGTATRFTRALGRARDRGYPLGVAIRQYAEAGAGVSDWFEVYVDLSSDGRLVPGYGWAFPVGDGSVNVGVGLLDVGRRERRPDLRRLHNDLLARLVRDARILRLPPPDGVRGGRLFMGASVWPPHGPGYVLVGDAAGMVNPATGEGIAYAYETARTAAQHLDRALVSGDRAPLTGYTEELVRRYGAYYRVGRALVRAIRNPAAMEWLVTSAVRSDRRLAFAMTLLLNLDGGPPRTAEQRGLHVIEGLARPWSRSGGPRSGPGWSRMCNEPGPGRSP